MALASLLESKTSDTTNFITFQGRISLKFAWMAFLSCRPFACDNLGVSLLVDAFRFLKEARRQETNKDEEIFIEKVFQPWSQVKVWGFCSRFLAMTWLWWMSWWCHVFQFFKESFLFLLVLCRKKVLLTVPLTESKTIPIWEIMIQTCGEKLSY